MPEAAEHPACYLVLAGYLAALAGAWTPGTAAGRALFLVGAGIVTVIGIWFSLGELSGTATCPEFEGLPMCFVSLLVGILMLGADRLQRRPTQSA